MHSGRLRRDLQVHCRAGQCPAPEAPGVLPLLRRSVHLGRIRLLRRGPGGVTPITDTLSPPGPSPVLRVWPAMAGRDPRPRSLSRVRPAGGDRPGAAVRSRPHVTPGRPVSRPSSNRSPVRNPDARPRAAALACHWCHSGGTVHPGHPDPPVRSSLADKRHIGARMGRLTARSRTPAARKLPGAPGKRPDSQEINGTMHEGQNMPGTLCA